MYHQEFNDSQLKCASLMALGIPHLEVAKECDMTLNTVKYLKKRPEFIKLVDELKANLKNIAIEETRDVIGSDIRSFRSAYKEASKKLGEVSAAFLSKVEQAVEQLRIEDISSGKLPQYIKACAELHQIAMESRQKALGLDSLLELSNEFTNIVQARTEQSKSTESFNQDTSRILEGN